MGAALLLLLSLRPEPLRFLPSLAAGALFRYAKGSSPAAPPAADEPALRLAAASPPGTNVSLAAGAAPLLSKVGYDAGADGASEPLMLQRRSESRVGTAVVRVAALAARGRLVSGCRCVAAEPIVSWCAVLWLDALSSSFVMPSFSFRGGFAGAAASVLEVELDVAVSSESSMSMR